MVFIREIYNIKRQSFKTWKSFGMETKWLYNYRRINKSSEQMIYYDSYQVLKLWKVLILQIKLSNSNMNIRVDFILY